MENSKILAKWKLPSNFFSFGIHKCKSWPDKEKQRNSVIVSRSPHCPPVAVPPYWQNNSYDFSLLGSRKISIASSRLLSLLSKPTLQLKNKLSKEHILFMFEISDYVPECLFFLFLFNKLLAISHESYNSFCWKHYWTVSFLHSVIFLVSQCQRTMFCMLFNMITTHSLA